MSAEPNNSVQNRRQRLWFATYSLISNDFVITQLAPFLLRSWTNETSRGFEEKNSKNQKFETLKRGDFETSVTKKEIDSTEERQKNAAGEKAIGCNSYKNASVATRPVTARFVLTEVCISYSFHAVICFFLIYLPLLKRSLTTTVQKPMHFVKALVFLFQRKNIVFLHTPVISFSTT